MPSGARTVSATSNPSIAVLVGPQPLCSILRKTLSSQCSSRKEVHLQKKSFNDLFFFNFNVFFVPSARAYCLARCLFCVTSCNGTSLSLSLCHSMSTSHRKSTQNAFVNSDPVASINCPTTSLSKHMLHGLHGILCKWTLQQASMWCHGSLY